MVADSVYHSTQSLLRETEKRLRAVAAARDRYKAALEKIAEYMGGLEAQSLAKEALKDES